MRQAGAEYQIAYAIGCDRPGETAASLVDPHAPSIRFLISQQDQDITFATHARNLRGTTLASLQGALDDLLSRMEKHEDRQVYRGRGAVKTFPVVITGNRVGNRAQHR